MGRFRIYSFVTHSINGMNRHNQFIRIFLLNLTKNRPVTTCCYPYLLVSFIPSRHQQLGRRRMTESQRRKNRKIEKKEKKKEAAADTNLLLILTSCTSILDKPKEEEKAFCPLLISLRSQASFILSQYQKLGKRRTRRWLNQTYLNIHMGLNHL